MSGSGQPTWYELRVEGVLDSRWTAWFQGLQVKSEGRETVISGPLVDQPALHGLLVKVRDLGLTLLAVRRLDPDDDDKRAATREDEAETETRPFSGMVAELPRALRRSVGYAPDTPGIPARPHSWR